MRTLLLAGGLLVLSGCSLLMPTPTRTAPGSTSIPSPTPISPPWKSTTRAGTARATSRSIPAPELTVRYQFTVDPTNIGPVDSPLWRDCQLNLKFKDFSAGQRYRLEAGHIGFRPWAKLYDQDNRELARGREGAARRSERRKARALC